MCKGAGLFLFDRLFKRYVGLLLSAVCCAQMLATLALSSAVKVARLGPRAPGRILGAAPGLYL